MDKGKCSEPGCENPNVLIFGTLDFCEKHAREITSNDEKLKENYKGFVVFGHWYLGKKFYWGIETEDGQEIANTLWNDDKSCRSREQAIESAKRSLDHILKTKPERDSYFSYKFLQSLREPETTKQWIKADDFNAEKHGTSFAARMLSSQPDEVINVVYVKDANSSK